MRKVLLIVVICLLAAGQTAAQTDGFLETVMGLTGISEIEDLDEDEYERLAFLSEHPLNLNHSNSSKLISSGLFTSYQVVSLIDYRLRHGDILSFSELASLDGFSEKHVRYIMPFVSLHGGSFMDTSSSGQNNEVTIRTGIKTDDENRWNYGMKYRLDAQTGLSAGIGFSRPNDSDVVWPDLFTSSIEYVFDKIPVRVLAGDHNLRFGQGLALWTGMAMSGLTAPSSLMRRPSGLSPSFTFAGLNAMTGAACSVDLGRLIINASLAFPGLKSLKDITFLPSFNLVWNHRLGQIGLTHYIETKRDVSDMKTSVDAEWCLRGTDVFGEISFDWKSMLPAGLAGVSFPAGDYLRLGTMLRAYPSGYASSRSGAQRSTTRCSNEFAATFVGEGTSGDRRHQATMSVDCAYFPDPKTNDSDSDGQIKVKGIWSWSSERTSMKVTINERIRTWGSKYRTELRTDAGMNFSRFTLNMRLNLLYCKAISTLGYIEGGFKNPDISAYGRIGIFCVDNWDDRIYIYERDAPGSYNVPAMYGRGLWGSAYASWKPTRWIRLYLRASYVSYCLMSIEKKKPGKAELRLQCCMSF